jgi:Zn-dependent peptidase ImmA (M78 family)
MKRKFPSSITIMGRKLKIKQGSGLVYQGQQVLGLCDYDKKMIYIEKNQTDESKFDTLIHECTHFFLILAGMDQKISESENEMYCQLITAFFNDLKSVI